MAIVRRVGPGSAFKVGISVYGLLGFVIGLLFALISMVAGNLATTSSSAPGAKLLGMGMGFGAVIIFPVLYGVFGGIAAAIGAAVYNLVAGWVGGLEVDIS